MTVDSMQISVNGTTKEIDIAPTVINDGTMVPIRFAAENLGCTVEWENSTQRVYISY